MTNILLDSLSCHIGWLILLDVWCGLRLDMLLCRLITLPVVSREHITRHSSLLVDRHCRESGANIGRYILWFWLTDIARRLVRTYVQISCGSGWLTLPGVRREYLSRYPVVLADWHRQVSGANICPDILWFWLTDIAGCPARTFVQMSCGSGWLTLPGVRHEHLSRYPVVLADWHRRVSGANICPDILWFWLTDIARDSGANICPNILCFWLTDIAGCPARTYDQISCRVGWHCQASGVNIWPDILPCWLTLSGVWCEHMTRYPAVLADIARRLVWTYDQISCRVGWHCQASGVNIWPDILPCWLTLPGVWCEHMARYPAVLADIARRLVWTYYQISCRVGWHCQASGVNIWPDILPCWLTLPGVWCEHMTRYPAVLADIARRLVWTYSQISCRVGWHCQASGVNIWPDILPCWLTLPGVWCEHMTRYPAVLADIAGVWCEHMARYPAVLADIARRLVWIYDQISCRVGWHCQASGVNIWPDILPCWLTLPGVWCEHMARYPVVLADIARRLVWTCDQISCRVGWHCQASGVNIWPDILPCWLTLPGVWCEHMARYPAVLADIARRLVWTYGQISCRVGWHCQASGVNIWPDILPCWLTLPGVWCEHMARYPAVLADIARRLVWTYGQISCRVGWHCQASGVNIWPDILPCWLTLPGVWCEHMARYPAVLADGHYLDYLITPLTLMIKHYENTPSRGSSFGMPNETVFYCRSRTVNMVIYSFLHGSEMW